MSGRVGACGYVARMADPVEVSSAGSAVWDGAQWVSHTADGTPASYWDGTQWAPVPTSAPAQGAHPNPQAGYPDPASGYSAAGRAGVRGPAPDPNGPAPKPAPGRGGVFGRVFWRVVVLAVGGGATIGLLIGIVTSIPDLTSPKRNLVFALLEVPYIGAALGLLLSIPCAPIVAGLLCWLTVPYRDATRTRRTAAIVAMGVMVPFVGLFAVGVAYNDLWTVLLVIGMALAAFVGAGLGGSFWLAGWYVKRMRRLAAARGA